ncbi:uncharacterized protein LOC129786635 isoform X2 [Lutzomyia longipalpis]|uniref:uncharacterized protein LOC129786635 isoform X2 n=1 Tax=Lutzomyia longipalpis TaxID=7200 RepID=UPI0024845DA1|nr:uncharacterized protein LOC129786635 isoform X2 [Lutzomyia longipalpis]
MSENDPGGPSAPPVDSVRVQRPITYKYIPNIKYNGFKVMVTSEKRPLDSIDIGDRVKKLFRKDEIRQIRQTGRKSLIIYCENHNVANAIPEVPTLQSEGTKVFIPLYFTTTCGVIWGINKKYSEEYLLENLEAGQLKITKVVRVKRHEMIDGQKTAIDTERVKVYFEGGCIPEYVFINYVRVPCQPFVMRATACKICWSYYHGAWNCPEQSAKCKRCGEEISTTHSSTTCQESPKCIACKGNHSADFVNCPEKIRQENINNLVAYKNMSKAEAALHYPHPKQRTNTHSQIVISNRYTALDDESDDDFPTLEEASRTKKTKKQRRAQIPIHEAPITSTPTAYNNNISDEEEEHNQKRDTRKNRHEGKTSTRQQPSTSKQHNMQNSRQHEPSTSQSTQHQNPTKRDRHALSSSNEEAPKRQRQSQQPEFLVQLTYLSLAAK